MFRRTMIGAALAMALAAPVQASDGPFWKVVDYWPKHERFTGCVGLIYQRADLRGYFTRTKVLHADGSLSVSSRIPAGTVGEPTKTAAVAAERARHFQGCWR